MSRQTLAQQLKQLHGEEEVDDGPEIDIDETADLDGYLPGDRSGGREHYADVGPSRLRGEVSQTLLSDKYAGKVGQRMKIFDDDDEEEGEQEAEEEGIDEGSDEDAEDDDEEDEDEDDDEEEDDEDDEEEEDEEEEEEEGEEGQEDEEESEAGPSKTFRRDTQLPARALDPVAALRESRQKDIEKGRGIKRQKALFEQLITLRITFQKALSAASKLPPSVAATSSSPEITESQSDALQSLAKINEQLFDLRQLLLLPGAETPTLGKRTRDDQDEAYWVESARESLSVADQSDLHAAPILSKWAGRIQAATAAQAGGKIKFIQTSPSSIFDAINAGLASKATNDLTFEETEEVAYRALLREVIETRQGGGEGLSAFRREKKKKREAERGGSKGRKLRYTVHDKAQNFAVPVALSRGWHEEQIDELFSSLFGGAGMGGAVSKAIIPSGISDAPLNGGLADLGGLRVF